jgi:hypothetical protein
MSAVSAAIIVLAGAVLLVAAAIPSAMTDSSRQRITGIGGLVAACGFLAWVVAYLVQMHNLP